MSLVEHRVRRHVLDSCLQLLLQRIRCGAFVGVTHGPVHHKVRRSVDTEELRTAAILARVGAGQAHTVTAADILTAATIGGARALRRDDLGRITRGAKADFVMVDLTHPAMQPLYDPVRSLVYAASERAIRHVFVGGQQVVRDGRALAFDYADASARLEMAQRRAIEKVLGSDWAGRSAAEIMPPTFPSR